MIYNGDTYYFQKDVLGDIQYIKNSAGKIVATYTYDAYGNCGIVNASGYTIGNINPFRYRGYYYDTETGFYYLQSRYYDPSIMRFINADDYELISTLASTIGQLNLYAYCNDNPIMYTDESGTLIWELVVLGIFAAIGAGVGGNYFNQLAQDYSPNNVAGYTVLGVLVGGLLGAALGALLILLIPSGGISIPIIKGSEMVLSTVGISQATIAGTIAVVVALGAGIAYSRIGNSGGYRIDHHYPNDHDPIHVHINGDDGTTKVDMNGNPIQNNRPMTPGERKAFYRLYKKILEALKPWLK